MCCEVVLGSPCARAGLLGLRAGFGALPFQICANLDTEVIASAQEHAQHLQSHVSQPTKQYDLCQEREQVRGGGLSPQYWRAVRQHLSNGTLALLCASTDIPMSP